MLFNIDDIKKEGPDPLSGSSVIKEKFLDQHLLKIENIKQLCGDLPSPGEIYFLWTLNSFNAFTFIPYIIKNSGPIEELTISSYSITQRILYSLSKYINTNKIWKVNILISESMQFRMPVVTEQLKDMSLKLPSFHVDYTWNHSKITLMKTQTGYYLVEGSGNFSENAQFEQYCFLNSERIFNYRKDCILQAHGTNS